MTLRLLHPEVAYRPCELCQQVMFDHKTGELQTDRQGNPIKRPKGAKTPCRYGPKECAKVSPERAHEFELSPKNELAYQHYKECRATGEFPDDPIVRRNAAIIRSIEDDCDKVLQLRRMSTIRR